MNARQSERKSPDSFSLSIRVVLYLSRESETACNPLINSSASTCFKLNGAQGLNSFIAAETPTMTTVKVIPKRLAILQNIIDHINKTKLMINSNYEFS